MGERPGAISPTQVRVQHRHMQYGHPATRNKSGTRTCVCVCVSVCPCVRVRPHTGTMDVTCTPYAPNYMKRAYLQCHAGSPAGVRCCVNWSFAGSNIFPEKIQNRKRFPRPFDAHTRTQQARLHIVHRISTTVGCDSHSENSQAWNKHDTHHAIRY